MHIVCAFEENGRDKELVAYIKKTKDAQELSKIPKELHSLMHLMRMAISYAEHGGDKNAKEIEP
jgi:hypothetical protein